MKRIRFTSLLSLASALLFSACSTDAPTAPVAPAASAASVLAATTPSALVVPTETLEQLYVRRELVRANQRAKRAALRPQYDQLRKAWIATRNETRDQVATLLRCIPSEYTGTAEVIGPAGGQLSIGANKLVIPRGALSQNMLLTMERPMGDLVAVTFGPHGLNFLKKAHLTLDYGTCLVPPSAQLKIVYATDDGSQILEILSSLANKGHSTIAAPIEHFSSYMIAY